MYRRNYYPAAAPLSYERTPNVMQYSHNNYPLYRDRMTAIPEPLDTPVYGRQNRPDYFPQFADGRNIQPAGGYTLPTHVGQPVWWYEVEVFRDPHPIPIIARDVPAGQVPYSYGPEYHRFRSTPFVTDVTDDHYGNVLKGGRRPVIEEVGYGGVSRPRSTPPYV